MEAGCIFDWVTHFEPMSHTSNFIIHIALLNGVCLRSAWLLLW